MEQEFIKVAQLLETGTDITSPHLRWLLRHAILEHCSAEAIHLIAYCKDIPVDKKGKQIWGETFAPTRSIVLNLEQHFYSCIDQIQDDDKMYTALRTLIIRELLDTAIHEAHHLSCSLNTGDFSNSKLEEDEAKIAAWKKSWLAARYWNAEITVFGSVLDELMEEFMDNLKMDTMEKPTMWKDLQVHMWENQLAFYNPDLDQECQIKDTFEAMAKTDDPWIDEPKQFLIDVIEETQKNTEDTSNIIQPEKPNKAETATIENQLQYPPEESAGFHIPETPAETIHIPAPPAQTEQIIIPAPPAIPAPPVTPAPALITPIEPIEPLKPPEPQTINILQIQQAVEGVMRTLFVHVMSKCGFTTEGGYNNPTAVLEPISIVHIPEALNLFSHMDTMDATGLYSGNQPCQGMIKGLISSQDLPMYRFYLNIGGKIYRRTFIPQNPKKLNANNELTTWAKEAQTGTKIMMLLQDKKGPTAHLKLEANTPFGQEEFKIWDSK